jgi:hypothetical protein
MQEALKAAERRNGEAASVGGLQLRAWRDYHA